MVAFYVDRQKLVDLVADIAREEGLKPEAIGELVGVTGSTVRRWFSTKVSDLPSSQNALLLAGHFDVRVEEFVTCQGTPELAEDQELREKLLAAQEEVRQKGEEVARLQDEIAQQTNAILGREKEHLANGRAVIRLREELEALQRSYDALKADRLRDSKQLLLSTNKLSNLTLWLQAVDRKRLETLETLHALEREGTFARFWRHLLGKRFEFKRLEQVTLVDAKEEAHVG